MRGWRSILKECERIGQDLGTCKIMMLRNHGSLIWGESIAEAFALAYQFENACAIQVAALGAGSQKLIHASETVAA